MTTRLFDALDSAGQALLAGLDTPFKIQAYLDSLPYIAEELDRTPLQVMQDGQCHCLDQSSRSHSCFWPDLFPSPSFSWA